MYIVVCVVDVGAVDFVRVVGATHVVIRGSVVVVLTLWWL